MSSHKDESRRSEKEELEKQPSEEAGRFEEREQQSVAEGQSCASERTETASRDNVVAAEKQNDAEQPPEQPQPPEYQPEQDQDIDLSHGYRPPRHGKGHASENAPPHPPGLPDLAYDPWDHRRKLVVMAALLMTEFCFLPIALYYSLWYGTTLSHGALFAIITSFFGVVTGLEFALRSWRLIQKPPTYRPIGQANQRWRFDATHWILTNVYTIMTALLIGASIPYEPLVRPLALPSTIFLLSMAILFLVTGLLHRANFITPVRISSVTAGQPLPPLTYTLVEDVVGVDGGGGVAYRERLAARWAASPAFRRLLVRLNWFWGAGTLVGGAITMAVLWTTPQDVAYGFGWAGPMVATCILIVATLHFVRYGLQAEKEQWIADGNAEGRV